MLAILVGDDQLAAVIFFRIAQEQGRRHVGAQPLAAAGDAAHRAVDVGAVVFAAGVAVEQRRDVRSGSAAEKNSGLPASACRMIWPSSTPSGEVSGSWRFCLTLAPWCPRWRGRPPIAIRRGGGACRHLFAVSTPGMCSIMMKLS
jgi:hypothetical protein